MCYNVSLCKINDENGCRMKQHSLLLFGCCVVIRMTSNADILQAKFTVPVLRLLCQYNVNYHVLIVFTEM